jgi:S1-C subfamily serine protease
MLVLAIMLAVPVAAKQELEDPPNPDPQVLSEESSAPPDESPPMPPPTETPLPTPTVVPTAIPSPTPAVLSAADIAAQVRPSVVQIIVPNGSATGVRVSAGVLTNAHVVGDATQVELVLIDGTHTQARVVKKDPSRDLALLETSASLPAVELELSARQRQGDAVYVMGFPLGIGGSPTLSHGLISAVRLDDRGVGLVQTDAPVSPGKLWEPFAQQ